MRLKDFEVNSIKKNSQAIFGKNTEVFLFGSRVDDNKKGGDIDLYIKTAAKEDLLNKKIRFITLLEEEIGEQKIDVIIASDQKREIEQEAIKNGIKL
jgi:predicted nucleotidyltransferase